MWSYVKIPIVPGESSEGVVCLEKYYVSEGDFIEQGDAIAVAHTSALVLTSLVIIVVEY